MNHKKIAKYSLRYLNLVFGVLMLVVLSLHIELISHNKGTLRLEKLKNSSLPKDQTCQTCQNQTIEKLTHLSGNHFFLSFLLIWKLEKLYFKYMVPFYRLCSLFSVSCLLLKLAFSLEIVAFAFRYLKFNNYAYPNGSIDSHCNLRPVWSPSFWISSIS